MPELPEVETTRRGIEPHVLNQTVAAVVVRQSGLRWPIPHDLPQLLEGLNIDSVRRRGKYLLLDTSRGSCILHLGMSGSLRVLPHNTPPQKHDHVDLCFNNGKLLRLRDPRRFGALLWSQDPLQHKLLKDLGPEPLCEEFDLEYLFKQSRQRKRAVKLFLMDSHVVVGVGNIYANEALFRAGIRPTLAAGRIGRKRYCKLVQAVKAVLSEAISQGGTTLRDFTASDGSPGYFVQKLSVYGKGEQPCPACGTKIKAIKLGQRATYFCVHCQR